jgi:alkylhydroperoxidase family enzyme
MHYAERLTRTPAAMTAADIEGLRAVGLDERAINDAIQVVSYFNYINRIADGLGLPPEEWIDDLGYER